MVQYHADDEAVIFCSFALNDSTVHDSVTSLCLLLSEMKDKYIQWPDEAKCNEEAANFHDRTGEILANITNCCRRIGIALNPYHTVLLCCIL